MSYIRLNLTDRDRTISGDVHGSIGDAVIASLSAEPESIHELELALARFQKPTGDRSGLASLRAGENFEPYDAGIMIVDLAAQVVMIDSTYSAPAWVNNRHIGDHLDLSAAQSSFKRSDQFAETSEGDAQNTQQSDPPLDQTAAVTFEIGYHDGEKLTDVRLPYRLGDTWLFVDSVPEYKGIYQERRAERAAQTTIEWFAARAVLFGKQLSEFVAREILDAPNLEAEDLLTEIHAKWLISPRADLGGRSAREILIAKKEFIDFDLQSRELQWSFTGECPPALPTTSHAFRFAGFGTHEVVLYYDLVKLLLNECYMQVREEKNISPADEVERLERVKSRWLETPNGDCQGKAPALVIEWERRRIPLAMSGKEAMIDPDCPVCQAIAADFETPMFWHLDGSEMDDRFEFSDCKSLGEWEANRRRREEFDREFDRRSRDRKGETVEGEVVVLADDERPFQ